MDVWCVTFKKELRSQIFEVFFEPQKSSQAVRDLRMPAAQLNIHLEKRNNSRANPKILFIKPTASERRIFNRFASLLDFS